jgi:hypothetical protein
MSAIPHLIQKELFPEASNLQAAAKSVIDAAEPETVTAVDTSKAANQAAKNTHAALYADAVQEANIVTADEMTELNEEQSVHAEQASKISFEFKDGKVVATDSKEIDLFMDQFGIALMLMGGDASSIAKSFTIEPVDLNNIDNEKVGQGLKAFEADLKLGTNLKDALAKLDDETKFVLSNLLEPKQVELEELVAPMLNHGPVILSANKLDTGSAKALNEIIDKLTSQAESRADLLKENPNYSKKLGQFQVELHLLNESHLKSLDRISRLPVQLQLNQKRSLDIKFNKELRAIEKKYKGQIAKEDLQSLSDAIGEINSKVKQNSGLLDRLGDFKSMIFSKEGFAAVATLLPALANILQGALSVVGLGKLAKPLTAVAHGASGIAKDVFQMVLLMGQRETSQALASKTEPAPARDSNAAKQTAIVS